MVQFVAVAAGAVAAGAVAFAEGFGVMAAAFAVAGGMVAHEAAAPQAVAA